MLRYALQIGGKQSLEFPRHLTNQNWKRSYSSKIRNIGILAHIDAGEQSQGNSELQQSLPGKQTQFRQNNHNGTHAVLCGQDQGTR